MFDFFKKLLGLPTEAEKAAASAPYKIETPESTVIPGSDGMLVVVKGANVINDQITDAVTQTTPVKKTKKPAKAKKAVESKPAKKGGRKPKSK